MKEEAFAVRHLEGKDGVGSSDRVQRAVESILDVLKAKWLCPALSHFSYCWWR